MSGRPVDDDDINFLLSSRVEHLVHTMFPKAIRRGSYFRVGSVYGEAGRSLGIRISHHGQCYWRDWAIGHRGRGWGGDMIQLIADAWYFGVRETARRWAFAWLGLDRPIIEQMV